MPACAHVVVHAYYRSVCFSRQIRDALHSLESLSAFAVFTARLWILWRRMDHRHGNGNWTVNGDGPTIKERELPERMNTQQEFAMATGSIITVL